MPQEGCAYSISPPLFPWGGPSYAACFLNPHPHPTTQNHAHLPAASPAPLKCQLPEAECSSLLSVAMTTKNKKSLFRFLLPCHTSSPEDVRAGNQARTNTEIVEIREACCFMSHSKALVVQLAFLYHKDHSVSHQSPNRQSLGLADLFGEIPQLKFPQMAIGCVKPQ